MNYKLIFRISKGLLLARWKQSLVAAVGVTFGIAMFTALQSFMTGLNKLLDGLILNRTPHVRLFKDIKPNFAQPVNSSQQYKSYYNFLSSLKTANDRLKIYNSSLVMQSLKEDKRVFGFSPRTSAQVFFNNGLVNINGIVSGVAVPEENRLFSFTDYVVEGKAEDLQNVSNTIILGKALANTLLANVGDVVRVTTAEGNRYSLKVCGFFQSGINDIDKTQSYASIATTQKILGKTDDYVTEIAIKLKDISKAPAIAREYASLYGADAEDIQTANAQFETGSRVRSIISYSVGITLLIVAGFGIYNILNMLIYEKMDSIAMLKATGFSGKDVRGVFLSISLTIGIAGGIVGLLVGYVLSVGINHIPFNTPALPTVKTYPVNNSPVFYAIGIGFSFITTYFAGSSPAKKASRVDPVVIIRGR